MSLSPSGARVCNRSFQVLSNRMTSLSSMSGETRCKMLNRNACSSRSLSNLSPHALTLHIRATCPASYPCHRQNRRTPSRQQYQKCSRYRATGRERWHQRAGSRPSSSQLRLSSSHEGMVASSMLSSSTARTGNSLRWALRHHTLSGGGHPTINLPFQSA